MNRLRDLREDKDLLQKDVAKMLNIKQQQYSRYECCKNDVPVSILIELSEFYRVNIDYLLGLTDVDKFLPRRKNDKK